MRTGDVCVTHLRPQREARLIRMSSESHEGHVEQGSRPAEVVMFCDNIKGSSVWCVHISQRRVETREWTT